MQEIMTLLSFDGNDQPWAVISRGTAEMAEAKGDTMLQSLVKFEEWKDHAKEVGFVNALNDELYELHTPEHCNHMILSCTAENILERVVCVECGGPMEKFIMYRCCN
ncbi:Protein SIEVE ELEMENT OCCLUSION A [Camellia lanceoleosa]|uniref:Protein SIEVE ELEMENT OCCLUSION A n=1 Tax=Camellia lanceoleosa TaxID=1840588 RepID=A0ACC0G8Y6_9ERIC|nr:Protein SIEVE ELEMENT OCCLUSION A [Camellia lanceoleosa]